MKLALRVAIFASGVALLFFGSHRVHTQTINFQNPGNDPTAGSAEMLVVMGGFALLMAFLPSSKTLGRWMSLKRQRRAQPAHFRRRRQRS
jgi:hypothetical protein